METGQETLWNRKAERYCLQRYLHADTLWRQNQTDEQRSEILLHIKQYIAAMNDENFDEPVSEDFEKVDETENTTITENEETMQTENSVNYQNPLYTHNRS